MSHRIGYVVCLALAVILGGCVTTDEEPKSQPNDKPKSDVQAAPSAAKDIDASKSRPSEIKAPTHKLEKAPFKIETSLKGVFESPDMTEVAIRPEAWTSPVVVMKAVPHGTTVKKGDTLIEVDLEKIDQAIKDLEADRRIAEVTLKQTEEELPIIEKTTPMDLAAAERAKKLADEDLKKFVDTDRALQEKNANFMMTNSKHFVEYAEEELRQLEKMYRDKDIREDTEEIILKRQRRQVEMAKFSLMMSETRLNDLIKITLPRQDQTMRDSATRTALALEKAKTTLPLALSQKKLALEKAKYDSEKAVERLAKLKRDRNLLTVTAPSDGIVYYGKCFRGQWATSPQVATRLIRGGAIPPEEVILTIVNPTSLFVRASVDEKDLPHVRVGQKARISATAAPDSKSSGKVDQVTSVPISAGSFEAKVALDASSAAGVMPGMACTVKLVPYQKPDALAVPATAVFTEELDDDKQYVYQPNKDGKPEKRSVTIGKTSGGKTEILAGLQEGDEILLDKPGPKKTPTVTRAPSTIGD